MQLQEQCNFSGSIPAWCGSARVRIESIRRAALIAEVDYNEPTTEKGVLTASPASRSVVANGERGLSR